MSTNIKDKIIALVPDATYSEAGDGMWTIPVEQ